MTLPSSMPPDNYWTRAPDSPLRTWHIGRVQGRDVTLCGLAVGEHWHQVQGGGNLEDINICDSCTVQWRNGQR